MWYLEKRKYTVSNDYHSMLNLKIECLYLPK